MPRRFALTKVGPSVATMEDVAMYPRTESPRFTAKDIRRFVGSPHATCARAAAATTKGREVSPGGKLLSAMSTLYLNRLKSYLNLKQCCSAAKSVTSSSCQGPTINDRRKLGLSKAMQDFYLKGLPLQVGGQNRSNPFKCSILHFRKPMHLCKLRAFTNI